MNQFPRALSVAALSVALLTGPLTASPAVAEQERPTPTASQAAPTVGEEAAARTILTVEHTDALAMALADGQLDLFTYADLPGAPRTRLDPAQTVFNLQDRAETRVSVPAGFDFLGPEGSTIWLAPQTQVAGVLWPGWNTEGIHPGELYGDKLTLELIKTKAPEGGAVDVFQSSPFGTERVFSSREKLPALQQPVGSHVHANWAFTATGTYELTFRASATRADGTPVSTEQTYTFVVGQLPAKLGGSAELDQPTATPSPSAVPEAPSSTSPEPSAPAPVETTEAAAAAPEQAPTYAPLNPAPAPGSAQESTTAQTSQQHAAPAVGSSNQVHRAPAAQNPAQQHPAQQHSAAGGSGSTAPQQCMATEELVKPAEQAQQGEAGTANRASVRTLDKPAFTIQKAVNTSTNKATSGHFDFGAVLSGGSLSAQVKDDRTSPATWKQPGALTFVLGDSAKTTMPGGLGHIAPAGAEVYLIGATQQATVPWVGWNTQNPELVAQASGPASLTLTDLQGPGRLSVFLSGNFGSAGTTVFNGVGDSFSVPLNTHQHANWVFTTPGVYSATLTWSVPLKSGGQVSASGTLNFEVGDIARAEQQPQQQDAGSGSSSKAPAGGGQGSVDSATGLVTRPDGSQVRIVGKTADGRDCTLSEDELAKAQQASARGELAYTGTSSAGTLAAAGGLALLAGAGVLLFVRRRSARRAA
ncbi:TIGR03773 family transporter-associated surface protein [Rothia sp. SD9660Na]|uniref:TIGR03773 family transporter-associated surface protein n=1 Tax=Rothia sp. SD9660Na TaxID=3047030 RepID=UPI0024BA24B7|nr:TIGR03773 family transporter-associated surface protein [Rothia sp. SD9660Na]WHS50348.1 TIGR03773 family transporter-associated surface protein [Rothia sp. SD9660Na]